jgi:hypothetical protein
MPRGITRHKASEEQTTLILDSRTKAALAADADDYDLIVGTVFNLLTSGGARSVTGILGGTEGRVIQIVNVGTDYIYLVNESSSSTATARILTALPAGATFNLAPNMSVFLSYNNTVNRWLVMHSSVVFDPEVDTPLANMLGRTRQRMLRATSMMAISRGSYKAKFTSKTGGDVANQAFGVVSGAQVSFSIPVGGDVIVAVSGTLKSLVAGVAAAPGAKLGARFNSDAALSLAEVAHNNGGGGDYTNSHAMFGVWGKNLAAGSHTADLCWGESSGNYGLYANAALPAVIVVLYPG